MPEITKEAKKHKHLESWLDSPQGQAISKCLSEELQKISQIIKGRSLLQVGQGAHHPCFGEKNIKQHWVACPDFHAKKVDVVTSLYQLPMDTHSVDVVYLPFVLDLYEDKQPIIDEIERTLSPMGLVIIAGINPWGIWNVYNKLGLKDCFGPQKAIPSSPLQLNRWFLHRGFRQCVLSGFWYLPPLGTKKWIDRFEFLNETGRMLWPYPAGFYLYIAQKYEAGMTPLHATAAEAEMTSELQPAN